MCYEKSLDQNRLTNYNDLTGLQHYIGLGRPIAQRYRELAYKHPLTGSNDDDGGGGGNLD